MTAVPALVTTLLEERDDDVWEENNDKIFANDVEVAKLERLKNPPLVKLDTTNNACAHACFASCVTTSSGTKEASREPAKVSRREGEGSWAPAAITSAWQSCTRKAARAVSVCEVNEQSSPPTCKGFVQYRRSHTV